MASKKPDVRSAIRKIDEKAILLVFPIHNRPHPDSLWREFFPRTRMKWEWSEEGDDRVAEMWQLMKKLSDCRDVVYSKWYQGRATFFSREIFQLMLTIKMQDQDLQSTLSIPARKIYDVLREDSPLSTRQVKKLSELQGKSLEPIYNRALRELFQSFLIVGFGEVEDGAFPSLAVGLTQNIYEDLWQKAKMTDFKFARERVDRLLIEAPHFKSWFEKHMT